MNLPDLTDTKPWWQSRTQVGILASSVAIIAGMFGLEVDAGILTEAALGLVALAANLLAARGRINATQQISTKQVLPGLTLPARK